MSSANSENFYSVCGTCSKTFEKIVSSNLYKHLDENALLKANRSGFRLNDYCGHQLDEITYYITKHYIYQAFDKNPSCLA